MSSRIRIPRLIAVVILTAFVTSITHPTTSGASGKTSFSANTHKAALLQMLDAHTGVRINQFSFDASPLYPTWVYYVVAFRTGGGEDTGEGFAHWVSGHWIDVYGPWSVDCGPIKTLVKIPLAVRNNFAEQKYCKGWNGTLG